MGQVSAIKSVAAALRNVKGGRGASGKIVFKQVRDDFSKALRDMSKSPGRINFHESPRINGIKTNLSGFRPLDDIMSDITGALSIPQPANVLGSAIKPMAETTARAMDNASMILGSKKYPAKVSYDLLPSSLSFLNRRTTNPSIKGVEL